MRFKFFMLLILAQTSLFAQTSTITLEEILQKAQSNAIEKEIADNSVKTAELNLAVFKGSLKPQIGLNATLPGFSNSFSPVIQNNGTTIFLPVTQNNLSLGFTASQVIPQTGGTISLASNLQRLDNFVGQSLTNYSGVPLSLGVNQPLFAFNAFKWDKKVLPKRLSVAEKRQKAVAAEINSTVTGLYMSVMVASNELAIATNNLEGNKRLLELAKERLKLGKIAKNGVLQLELQLLNSTRSQQQAQLAMEQATTELYLFLGQENGDLFTPELPLPNDERIPEAEEAITTVKRNHYAFAENELEMLEQEQNMARVKGDGGPSLMIQGSYGLTGGASNVGDVYSKAQQQQILQVGLSLPILDWNQQKNRKRLAFESMELSRKQIKRNELGINISVRKLIAQLNSLKAEIELTAQMKEVAASRSEITQKSYVLGAISITELLIAQRESDQSNRSYLTAVTNYWIAYYQLKALTLE